MRIEELIDALREGKKDEALRRLYGTKRLKTQKDRYERLLRQALKLYGDEEAILVSAPGRTEIGGNHTDHQLGCVLAASIDLDIAAVVIKNDDAFIRYASDSFTVKPVDLHLLEVQEAEKNTTEALIRGIAAGFTQNGYAVGGCKIYAESDVLPGSGMSSSAAFEILLATIQSLLYNHGAIAPLACAKIGQYAENVYFGKASGLMDQAACAVGGFAAIDFYDAAQPVVEKIDYDFSSSGLLLVLTDCKQSHAELSEEYSRIPADMKAVAGVFGQQTLSRVKMDDFLAQAMSVRKACGDRAFLRAFHFLHETRRAKAEKEALKADDTKRFLETMIASGRSSFMYLQNVYPSGETQHQSLAVGLALSEHMLNGKGAWRVHGGGFAGTIQAFVPEDMVEAYRAQMEAVFGPGCCYVLQIRNVGGVQVA